VNHFHSSFRTVIALGAGVALTLAACAGDDDDTAVTEPPVATDETPAGETTGGPAISPATIVADEQESDGSSIVVAQVDLPAAGFIAVHADGGGSPGPVIGVSELLPAGTTDDVPVSLDEPLTADATLYPMVHIDTNDNGVYEFGTVDGVDGPGLTAEGDVAVVPADIAVAGGDTAEQPTADGGDPTDEGADSTAETGDNTITISNFSFEGVTEVPVGTTVTVVNTDATAHTWTAEDGTFDSSALNEGDTFEFTFSEPGEFAYFCNFHPAMTGTIVVTG
jgi:plastocyanin